jgi:DNA-binding NtrC family response regulator
MATEYPRETPIRAHEIRELRLDDLERFARTGRKLALREWLSLAEAWRIAQALREHRGNRAATARALGIGRRTLYTKMEKLGLVPSWGVAAPELSRDSG